MIEKNCESHVGTDFNWKKFRDGLWQCRYYPGGEIGCTNRQCEKCGWNPVVAEARTAAIQQALEATARNEEENYGKQNDPA